MNWGEGRGPRIKVVVGRCYGDGRFYNADVHTKLIYNIRIRPPINPTTTHKMASNASQRAYNTTHFLVKGDKYGVSQQTMASETFKLQHTDGIRYFNVGPYPSITHRADAGTGAYIASGKSGATANTLHTSVDKNGKIVLMSIHHTAVLIPQFAYRMPMWAATTPHLGTHRLMFMGHSEMKELTPGSLILVTRDPTKPAYKSPLETVFLITEKDGGSQTLLQSPHWKHALRMMHDDLIDLWRNVQSESFSLAGFNAQGRTHPIDNPQTRILRSIYEKHPHWSSIKPKTTEQCRRLVVRLESVYSGNITGLESNTHEELLAGIRTVVQNIAAAVKHFVQSTEQKFPEPTMLTVTADANTLMETFDRKATEVRDAAKAPSSELVKATFSPLIHEFICKTTDTLKPAATTPTTAELDAANALLRLTSEDSEAQSTRETKKPRKV